MEETTGVGAAETAVAAQPESGEATPAPVAKVDLTQVPEFREFQSKTDARIAAAEKAARAAEDRARALAAQLEQQQLSSVEHLDAAERAEFYKRKLDEQRHAEAETVARNELARRAYEVVQAAGIDFNDPRLNEAKAYGPTPEGVLAIAGAVAKIAAEDKQAAALAAQKVAEDAAVKAKADAQRAKVEALNEAGVTATSGAASAVGPRDEKAEQIAAFRKRWSSLRGSGANGQRYVQFMTDLKAAGLSVADLGY